MQRSDLTELHFITHTENLPSIMAHGILSNHQAARLGGRSVANPEVQSRRSRVSIPGGRPLHSYANLYFNGRNAMLYEVLSAYRPERRVAPDDLVVLGVSSDVLDQADVVISDMNAATTYPRFGTVAEMLGEIDRDEVFAERWPGVLGRKERMMAEVLVPGQVPAAFIERAHCASEASAGKVRGLAPTLDVTVNRYLFFAGPKP